MRTIMADKLRGQNAGALPARQIEGLILVLRNWANRRAGKLFRAYLTVRDGGMLFVVLQRRPRWDPDLEDELSSLDVRIAREKTFNGIRLNVLALPPASPDAISTFLCPTRTIRL